MGKVPLDESYYSRHFIVLKLMGSWIINRRSPKLLGVYVLYKVAMTWMVLAGSFYMFVYFYTIFGDLKEMSWNLCVNMLLLMALLKNSFTFVRCNVINAMRRKLHKNALTVATPEDEDINRLGEKEMRYIRILFYGGAMVFVPLWLISWYCSYLWGSRRIPVPIWVPFDWDPDDKIQYHLMFLACACGGGMGVIFVIETEMAMYALLIQISREYNRLLNNIRNINRFYGVRVAPGGGGVQKVEVNPWLRRMRVKSLLRGYSRDHQQLIQYTKDFEMSYSYAMLLQVALFSILMTVLAMLCILEYDNFTLNISYQAGYITILFVDMFLTCWFCSRLHEQCLSVGDEAYSILWYQMSADIQRDLCMMIRRSQHPPKITSGKLMELNLNAFMLMIRNIYSWVTLFRQLDFKTHF